MTPVTISEELKAKVPQLKLSCIECDVTVSNEADMLWNLIDEKVTYLRETLQLGEISKLPAVASSRLAYRACGKDPARYRLSAEALLRRVVQGKGIYRVNNIVDIVNIVSITTGFSIGGYDVAHISGNVVFSTGSEGEPYEGIGRGSLNIDMMPVFRDENGAFGSPTSDSVRTAVTSETNRFLMIIIGFGAADLLPDATLLAVNALKDYAEARKIDSWIVG